MNNNIIALLKKANFIDLSTLATDTSTASVVVILTDEIPPKILLTKRSQKLSSHAGEMGLVGGKKDATDPDIIYTACRESFEEIGLLACDIRLIGGLDTQISKSGLVVRPLVGVICPSVIPKLVISADEIDSLYWIDVDFFKTRPTTHPISTYYQGQKIHLYADGWYYKTVLIWGLTARILQDFMVKTANFL